jgi:hypothetical protein
MHITRWGGLGWVAALGALALGFAAAGCDDGDDAARCDQVFEASCPDDMPQVNFGFPYGQSECEDKLDAPCAAEFGDYLDCLRDDPTCCSAEPNAYGTLDCIYTSCNQDAYIECVFP